MSVSEITWPRPRIGASLRFLLTADLCPALARAFRWWQQPLVVLSVAAVTALLTGFTVAPQGYLVAAGLLAVIAFGVAWPKVALIGLRAELHFHRPRCREGEIVRVVLRLRNGWPWPVWGLALEDGFRRSAAGVEVALARVPARSITEFVWDFVPTARGEYPLAAPRITTTFPFALYRATKDVGVESRLIVWPRTVPLPPPALSTGPSWTRGACHDRRAGHEGDTIGVRPLRSGDSLRHVHWAQTARHGRFIVRERQASATNRARVWLDTEPASRDTVAFESSVRLAASLIETLHRHGAEIECVLGEETLAVTSRTESWRRFNDRLATFEPGSCEPDRVSGQFVYRPAAGAGFCRSATRADAGACGWAVNELCDEFVVTTPCRADVAWARQATVLIAPQDNREAQP